ncbi:aspartate/glutamate racemase family protein [Candidatus Woesearchaeota archaeon]|nr:aspartate/glutamate racemase family protein [Candidatus Woesearchaeota archaeon]
MKTIGLIGGMSWESTAEYYRIINDDVRKRVGGLRSAKIVLYSVDFGEVEQLQRHEDWGGLAGLVVDAAQRVERAGADVMLICTNTMHNVADDVQNSIQIPLLHIVDVTAEKILCDGYQKVCLFGTKFTMEKEFYKGRLQNKGLDVVVPSPIVRDVVHRIIYDELCVGKILPSSRSWMKRIIEGFAEKNTFAFILGCTELPLLIQQKDFDASKYVIKVYDTTKIHAEAAVDYALSRE